MNIEVKFVGLTQLQDKIKKFPVRTNQGTELAMKAFTLKCKNDVQKELNTSGEGRKRGKNPKQGVPSSPGEPPHLQSGHLKQSVYQQVKNDGKKVTGIVGNNAEYAAFLEFGTSKMQPRPYLRPVVEKNVSYFENTLKGVLTQIL